MNSFAIRIAVFAALTGAWLFAPDTASHAQDATPAVAQTAATPAGLLAELKDADYGRKAEIASALATSNFPRTAQIIDAMIEGLLYAAPDGRVVIETTDTAKPYIDALTGAAVAGIDANSLDKIRTNNGLRRELRGISARVSLLSPDPALRRSAAAAAFQAHDPDSLAGIETALKVETESDIKNVLAQARASIILQGSEASEKEKLDAITVMTRRGDQEAINVLLGAAANGSAEFRDAATKAASGIQTTLSYWIGAQNVYYGISLGSVLLLAAIGLAITFGVMGVINMAHGEMIMLGAYTTYVVQQTLAVSAPALMPFSLPIALPLAFLVAGSMGVLIERFIIRFLYGRPLETLLATWGLSLILQQAIRSVFGPTNKSVTSPSWMSGSFEIGHLSITYSRLWIIFFALFVLFALMMFLKRTHFGLQMRAVTQNRKMASAMGVRTNWVDALTFGLGSGVAGIAGVALSQIDNVSPNLGQSYIVDSFMVVVFGGVGNLWGTLVGALSLGVANKFLEPYAGAVVGKILVLIFIILFIQRRPRGLFALKGRAIES